LSCVEIEGGVRLFCYREILQERSRNEGGGEEGRALGHILNITDRFTNEIILTVTTSTILLVSMPRHCTVCLFESHCNSVGNYVCKNLHVIALFGFFIPSIPTVIPSVSTDNIFPSVFTDGVSNGKIQSVNITAKYKQKKSTGVFVCICQFFNNEMGREECHEHLNEDHT
jgi:hypothetical protein